MIDKANGWTLEQHVIVYVVYLSNIGKWPHVTKFVEFLAFRDGTTNSMYEVDTWLLEKMQWMSLNQITCAIDGVSSTTRHCAWLMARMHAEVPTLINVHCIVHHRALAARNVAWTFSKIQMFPTKFISVWTKVQIDATSWNHCWRMYLKKIM